MRPIVSLFIIVFGISYAIIYKIIGGDKK